MLKILQHLQQYVPSYRDGHGKKCCEQGIVGDQLTVERGINGLMEVSNGFTPAERNEGIHFGVADFHGGMKFLEVRINEWFVALQSNLYFIILLIFIS